MENKDNDLRGFVHRHPKHLDKFTVELENCETLFDLFSRAVDRSFLFLKIFFSFSNSIKSTT